MNLYKRFYQKKKKKKERYKPLYGHDNSYHDNKLVNHP